MALEDGEEAYWIETSFFSAILDRVRPRSDVQITFDDSNVTDFSVAFPALRERGMTAKFFMVARRIDRPGYVSLAQLKSMVEGGMIIGTHGLRHRPWRGLSESDFKEELVEAKNLLEEMTGRPITEAACPWGSYDRKVLAALRKAGYQRVYTSDQGPADSGAWLQPRTSVMSRHDLASIARAINPAPRGLSGLWRTAKLAVKRWR